MGIGALPLLVFPRLSGPPHDLLQARWFGPPRLPEMLVDVVPVAHLRPWITHQLPADQPGIAAVHRVAKHAFDRMGAEQLKEARFLDRRQLLNLLFR